MTFHESSRIIFETVSELIFLIEPASCNVFKNYYFASFLRTLFPNIGVWDVFFFFFFFFGGGGGRGEVFCLNISSSASLKNQVILPKYYFIFAWKWQVFFFGGGGGGGEGGGGTTPSPCFVCL